MAEQCRRFTALGFHVCCPDLCGGRVFGYEESEAAYHHFYSHGDPLPTLHKLTAELAETYERVYILGYSAGATLAWRCSDDPHCSGVIACYGSRIRDHLDVTPQCPALLLFAEADSFDVAAVTGALAHAPSTRVLTYPAAHGFCDPCSPCYDPLQAQQAETAILRFFSIPHPLAP